MEVWGAPLPNVWDSQRPRCEDGQEVWAQPRRKVGDLALGPQGPGPLSSRAGRGPELRCCPPLALAGVCAPERAFFTSGLVHAHRGGRGPGGWGAAWGAGGLSVSPAPSSYLEQDRQLLRRQALSLCCSGTSVNCGFCSAACRQGKERPSVPAGRPGCEAAGHMLPDSAGTVRACLCTHLYVQSAAMCMVCACTCPQLCMIKCLHVCTLVCTVCV